MQRGFPGVSPGALPCRGVAPLDIDVWFGRASHGWRQLWQRRDVAPVRAARPDRPAEVRSPTWREERLARLEAVLFLAREPLSSRKIAQLANLADGTEARKLVRHLNRMFDESASAFRVEELAGGFQLLTRPRFGPWLKRLWQTPVEMRLSAPALETLAVVAYRQPVLRAEVEAIRGVQSGDILRQLMDRDLVRISGRADELGRPLMYGTTRRFLQIFGLRHLDELPRAKTLRRSEGAAHSTNGGFPPHSETAEQITSGASQNDQASQPSKCIDEEDAT